VLTLTATAFVTLDRIINSSVDIELSLNLQDDVTSVLVASFNVSSNDPPAWGRKRWSLSSA
jgi:hypothetical protein